MIASSNIIFFAYSVSDFFGKLIFLGLFTLSVITWYVLIQKVLLFRNVRKDSNKLQEAIISKPSNMLNLSVEDSSSITPFNKIYLSLKTKAIEILDKNLYFQSDKDSVFLSRNDVELIEAHIESVITKEGKRLEKNLFILSTVVSLAPFLGILGTVWGILISLSEMQKGGLVHSNSVLLGGLSTALATTVLGLVIAIPALVAYNYLKNWLASYYLELNDFTSLLLSNLEIQYRRVET